MIEHQTRIVTSSCCTQRSLLTYGDTIDLRAVTRDFTNGITAVGCDAVAETLFAVANRDYTLGVAIPGYIVDTTSDDMVFSCIATLATKLFIDFNFGSSESPS